METRRVLFLVTDKDARQVWAQVLARHGIEVLTAATADEGVDLCEVQVFDLILIDVLENEQATTEACRRLRAFVANPIVLLADDPRESHLLKLYRAGADECIGKPISPLLLLAKVDAWLRRSWNVPAESLDTVQAGDFCLDGRHHALIIEEGQMIKLTNLEFRLLHLLMRHPGRSFESQMIVERVWGYSGDGDSATLKHVVYRLRRKLETEPAVPRYLQTVPGSGYVFHP